MARVLILLTALLATSLAQAQGGETATASANPRRGIARLNPLGMIMGYTDLTAEFGIVPHVLVGPLGSFWFQRLGSATYTAFGFGGQLSVYLNPDFLTLQNTWIGSASVSTVPATLSAGDFSGTTNTLASTVRVGHLWMWSNGFNMSLLLGTGYATADKTVTVRDSSGATKKITSPGYSGVYPAIEWSLGYAF